eukprot:scaffold202575_cov31-Tisochrysis_lutea.AAC.4
MAHHMQSLLRAVSGRSTQAPVVARAEEGLDVTSNSSSPENRGEGDEVDGGRKQRDAEVEGDACEGARILGDPLIGVVDRHGSCGSSYATFDLGGAARLDRAIAAADNRGIGAGLGRHPTT